MISSVSEKLSSWFEGDSSQGTAIDGNYPVPTFEWPFLPATLSDNTFFTWQKAIEDDLKCPHELEETHIMY